MSKRVADNYLTDRNWDEEVPAEEAGSFQVASQKQLQQRKIRKAVRRVGSDTSQSTGSSSVFAGFGGFTALSGTRPSDEATTGASSITNTVTTTGCTAPPPLFNFGAGTQKSFAPSTTTTKPVNGTSSTNTTPRRRPNLEQLRRLNENVSAWINKHIAANPYCVLTPIFTDYERYLATIEGRKKSEGSTSVSSKSPNAPTTSTPTDSTKPSDDTPTSDTLKTLSEVKTDTATTFSFVANSAKTAAFSTETTDDKKPAGGVFSFATGNTQMASDTKEAPKFSFSDGKKDSAGFSFATTKTSSTDDKKDGGVASLFGGKTESAPFTFATGTNSAKVDGVSGAPTFSFSAAKTESVTSEEEEYVPPKPETSSVQEEDAFYTKRCKLFVQKDGAWQERGLGNLHLKPCNSRTQLLIRADTSLGNILLNIMLSEDTPVSRQGKNNVTLICVPNPPLAGDSDESPRKPASMLLKVKTADDADELLNRLSEAKTG